MKKLIALLLALCMVAAMFVGCTGEDDPANTDEVTTLTFWQAGGDTVGAASVMRLLLDKFELQNPGIKVEYQAIPWSQDPHVQFQTAIAGGECADVLVLGSPLDFQLAGEGNLLPLDDLLTEEVKNDLSETLKNNCIYNGNANPDMKGKMMSLPLYGGTRAMLYNKEIFDFFGVAYPTEGMSHADLLEMAKKLTGDMNGKHVSGLGTRATTSEQYLNFVWNYGAQIVNPETMQAGTDSEAWKKGITDYMAFYEAGTTPEGAASMGGSDLLAMFVNGEVAMFMAAIDYAQAIIAEPVEEGQIPWSEKLGVAPLVGETYATCYTGADVLAVPATTKNKDAAAKLLNFLMGTEVQATYCKNVGFFPGAKSAAEDSFFKDDPIQAGFAATMAGCHYFDNYGVPGVGTILKEEIQRLIAGECTIDEYQAAITERINAAIAEMDA